MYYVINIKHQFIVIVLTEEMEIHQFNASVVFNGTIINVLIIHLKKILGTSFAHTAKSSMI